MREPGRIAPRAIILYCAFLLLGSCVTVQGQDPAGDKLIAPAAADAPRAGDLTVGSAAVIAKRRSAGASTGAAVLRTALDMMEKKTVVVGACWDFVNKAFNDAGFPSSKRETVFKGTEKGPYADPTLIKPGDWLYFVNLTFGNVGHSAIFVEWIDFDKRSAITIEYIGQKKEMPGRFREYDITKCYAIFRGRQ
jgi:hypothetical protein